MTFVPRPQEIYRHFKGNLYQIVTIAEHSETGEKLVIYQAMYGEFKTYARELSMFTSCVDHVKYPQLTQEFRFELLGPDAERQRRECAATMPAQASSAAVSAQTASAAVPAKEASAAPTPNLSAATPAQTASTAAPSRHETEQPDLDPLIVEFLDADTYEERLNILAAVHHKVTQDMITTMAVACDVEVGEGEVEERYSQLKKCLITMEKFECNRMR